jgi:hypothetical protein
MIRLGASVESVDVHAQFDLDRNNASVFISKGTKGQVVTTCKHLEGNQSFIVQWGNGCRCVYPEKSAFVKG